MKRLLALASLLSLGLASAQSFGLTLGAGYRGGAGIEANLFARQLGATPYGLRLAATANIGDAYDDDHSVTSFNFARPDENGIVEGALNVGAGLDLLYTLPTEVPNLSVDLYAGPRANFFIGTESDSTNFATTESLQYGLGGGAAATYKLARFLNLVFDAGLDGYLPAPFNVTTKDGSATVRPGDPNYQAVDDLVQQPKLLLKLKLGLQLSF